MFFFGQIPLQNRKVLESFQYSSIEYVPLIGNPVLSVSRRTNKELTAKVMEHCGVFARIWRPLWLVRGVSHTHYNTCLSRS